MRESLRTLDLKYFRNNPNFEGKLSKFLNELDEALEYSGLSQCYVCDYGETCAAGAVVSRHGFIDEIIDYHLQVVSHDAYRRAEVIAHRLGVVL
jgi:hypothetical protein